MIRQNDALDMLRWQAFQYLSDSKEMNHPYVSPLVAEDLSSLPPAVVISDFDQELARYLKGKQ